MVQSGPGPLDDKAAGEAGEVETRGAVHRTWEVDAPEGLLLWIEDGVGPLWEPCAWAAIGETPKQCPEGESIPTPTGAFFWAWS